MAALSCPNCGKISTKQGSHNLHVYHCSFRVLKGKLEAEPKAPEVKEVKQTIEAKVHEHDWRLLNLKNRDEVVAYQNGFKKICRECEELE